MWGVTIPRVTLRYTIGYEPLAHARAFDLSGRVLPVKQVIINLSEAVWRFIGVGVADFVKLSVIICEICEELNHQQVIISISEAVRRFRSRDSLISEILFLKISQIYILFYCLCHLVEMEVGGGG